MLEIRPLQHNFQTRMRMDQLRNELFKWLQGDAETSVYCAKKAKPASPLLFGGSMCPWLHLLKRKLTPICGACPPKSSAPLSASNVRRQQSERKDQSHKWRKLCVKKPRVTLPQTRQSGHHNLNVSTHLFTSLCVGSNQSFMFCINNNVFYQHFF